jgi:MoaA/NifB/PqqE/SkfB family radical SAM enzyme
MSPHPHAAGASGDFRYPEAPRRVYWELTRACALACRHCRAEALHERLPDELDTAAAFGVLESLARATPAPVVVLTGGDPLERPDFWQILEHAIGLGLHVDVAPSATPRLDREVILRLADHGVGAMSLSLDGSTPARHDAMRGIAGCYEMTVRAAQHVAEAGIALQVNTLVTADTLADLPAVRDRAAEMRARRWSLFFLVTTGRGSLLPQISPAEAEALLEWLAEQSGTTPFVIATTEAPQYRRVLLRRRGIAGDAPVPGAGMRDGNGICFVSYRGDVMPSGFLPLSAGNVREHDVLELYRTAPLFVRLRDPARFGGRCGSCEFGRVCGGSRGRAFAAGGDPFAEDPLCGWQPGGISA